MTRQAMIDLTGDDDDGGKGEAIGMKRFWDGAVKLTHNDLVKLGKEHSMTFDELLGDDIKEAKAILLTSYCIEEDWLLPKLKRIPKVVLVGHPDERKTSPTQIKPPNWYNTGS